MPCLERLDAARNSDLRAAIVGRDAIATAPGSSVEGDVGYTRSVGVPTEGPQVFQNAASLRKLFRWKFSGCSGGRGPVVELRSGVIRCARECAAEWGCVRCASRVSHARPGVSAFGADYSASISDASWLPYQAFLG